MTYKPITNQVFSLWALLAGLQGLLALVFVTREPSEAQSALIFGLSLQRLVIATAVLLLASFFIVLSATHYYRLTSWNELINKRPHVIRYLLAGVIVLGFIILYLSFFIPDYRFPTLLGYLSRLRPVLIWVLLVFIQTFIFLAYHGGLSIKSLKEWKEKETVFIVLTIVGSIWGLVALTGIGIVPDDFHWNVAGLPLLAGQVWIATGVILIAWFLQKRFEVHIRYKSFLLPFATFIGIWIVSAVIWINTPLGPTFNAPGPYPPSREFYPFVDAALFDLGAQSAIYGRGFFFGTFLDRGLLPGFLAILHLLFGQNYTVVVGVQSAVYAVFPAILYLLGKKAHSISAGLLIATLAIFKVTNAITGGRLISTSHPKLMLTEFPTGIVIVLISLFLVKWLTESSSKAFILTALGGSIGIGILLRHNVFFMFPVFFILGLVAWKLDWKRALTDILLVVVAFFITISPWMWRSQRVAGEPLFFLAQFNRVIEERYQPESNLDTKEPASNLPSRSLRSYTGGLPTTRETLNLDEYAFIPKHFVHNIITSVLVLPPSPVLHDFRHVIDEYPYWDRVENASLDDISSSMGLFLAANLIILSIGIGTAWKRVKFAGLVPLLVFLFYNLASAFARTSGGRYIVPVDWVIYFYYAIGLIEIVRFCISALGFHANGFFEKPAVPRPDRENTKLNFGKAGLVILPFLLIVAMLPAIEMMSPGEKSPETSQSLLEQLEQGSFLEDSGFTRQDVDKFLENPDALLLSGHGLYPRYYSYDQGEPILPGQMTPYTAREFPRLVFTLLLPNMNKTVLLPIDEPRLYFPDAAEVIVAGCKVGEDRSDILAPYLTYIDAAFVVIVDGDVAVHTRIPEAPLSCPLREPVCDNNHNCN